MCNILITSNSLGRLKESAKKKKKNSGIKHAEALEFTAKENNFENWRQIAEAAKRTLETETAYQSGIVLGYDIKDGEQFSCSSNLFVDDHFVDYFCALDILTELETSDELEHEVPPKQTHLTKTNPIYILSENGFEFRFLRCSQPERFRNINVLQKALEEYCIWQPEYIWFKGRFLNTWE